MTFLNNLRLISRKKKGVFSASLLLFLMLGVIGVTVLSSSIQQPSVKAATTRPNILLILTDDQRWDTIDTYMPKTKARIFDQGVRFNNAFATTPVCCPSRSSIFTGMYAFNHGVNFNSDTLLKKTFIQNLQQNNYYTGIVGTKYLNSWNENRPRSEFDYWALGGGYTYPYININGTSTKFTGYVTNKYKDYALTFLDQAVTQQDPFMLIVATNAPHDPAIPAPGDETLYTPFSPSQPPNFNEADVSDKPLKLRKKALMSTAAQDNTNAFHLKQLQTLNAVDNAVDAILTKLESQGKLDNTFVVYMSDNGWMWGEHRLNTKYWPYEESIRVPMAVRYPPLITSPRVEDKLVANIDIAPTFYELAGIQAPAEVNGKSLLGLFSGQSLWRDDLLIEGYEYQYSAVRTKDYKYIEHLDDTEELYDLNVDPYELQNQINNPTFSAVSTAMLARLNVLKPNRALTPRYYDSQTPFVTYGAWIVDIDDRASGETYRSTKVPATISFTTEETTAINILTYKGPTQGKAQVFIDNKNKGVVDLYASDSAYLQPLSYPGLTNVKHKVRFVALGQKNVLSKQAEVRFDAYQVNGKVFEDNNLGIIIGDWSGAENPNAYQGSLRQASKAGVQASFITPGSFTWITRKGTYGGLAEVYIDNVLTETLDLYSPTLIHQFKYVSPNLSIVKHAVRVVVTGQKNASSSGTNVFFDGFITQ